MAKSGKYDAVICLGAVIRGATSHYDYVCSEVSKGIASVSLTSDIPVMFGVLTTDNIEQAIERAGTKAGNKGYDCALVLLNGKPGASAGKLKSRKCKIWIMRLAITIVNAKKPPIQAAFGVYYFFSFFFSRTFSCTLRGIIRCSIMIL